MKLKANLGVSCNDLYISSKKYSSQGLYGQGKSGMKSVFFSLVRESQGKSGKVREFFLSQGES